jgi:phage-related protein
MQSDAGFELFEIQRGLPATDTKPMPAIGKGVEEIRLWDESGTYRVVYIARLPEAVYVLHASQKKTQKTSPRDLLLAQSRLEALLRSKKQPSKNR